MVRGGLAGGIGAAGIVGGGLGEGRIAGAEGAEHLVGRDMVEAESVPARGGQAGPVIAGGFEQDESAGNVGVDEVARPVDRAVHMGLGGEMHDEVGLVGGEELAHRRGIGDIGADQHMARIAQRGVQRVFRGGVGHLVHV